MHVGVHSQPDHAHDGSLAGVPLGILHAVHGGAHGRAHSSTNSGADDSADRAADNDAAHSGADSAADNGAADSGAVDRCPHCYRGADGTRAGAEHRRPRLAEGLSHKTANKGANESANEGADKSTDKSTNQSTDQGADATADSAANSTAHRGPREADAEAHKEEGAACCADWKLAKLQLQSPLPRQQLSLQLPCVSLCLQYLPEAKGKPVACACCGLGCCVLQGVSILLVFSPQPTRKRPTKRNLPKACGGRCGKAKPKTG